MEPSTACLSNPSSLTRDAPAASSVIPTRRGILRSQLPSRGELELICVTMSSQKYEKYEDTAALFDYCFDSFDQVTLSKQSLKGFVIPVLEGDTQVQEVRIYPDNSIAL